MKKSSRKKPDGKALYKRKMSSRKQLRPRKEKRGLETAEIQLDFTAKDVAALVAEIAEVGGVAIGAYREPLSGRSILLASLPLNSIEPTPFQRRLSPTHTKRLAEKIEESGSFLDPLIVVRGSTGRFWTPNGYHRLAAAKLLGLRQITVLISPDEKLAFKILALNTEKAHNLRDKSLEVIRMARELAIRKPRAKESAFAAEFEAPELLTLGIIYEENKRFGGGAYRPFLRKLDRFSDGTLAISLRKRDGFAARLLDIDRDVKRIIDKLQKRGFRSPYLRNYIVARINPVRFHRAKKDDTKPPMPLSAALIRMATLAKQFNLDSIKLSDLAMVAAVSNDED